MVQNRHPKTAEDSRIGKNSNNKEIKFLKSLLILLTFI